MPRVRKGAARRRKHKRILKAAKGFFGAGSRRYRIALDKTFRAGVSATRDRKRRKRDFRRLWITRITAACRQRDLRYSEFMFGLAAADVALNRKMLSEIAIADPAAFDAIVALATDGAAGERARAAKAATAAPARKPSKPQAPPAPAKEAEEDKPPAKAVKKAVKKAARKAAPKAEKPDDDKGGEKPKKKAAPKKAVKKAARKTVKKAVKKAARKTAKKADKRDS